MPDPTPLSHTLGSLFALGSAAMWATAAILFRRIGESAAPLAMNLGKGLIALACLGVALAGTGFSEINGLSWLYLAISGVLGITLGDTFFFMTLMRLGPRRMLLLDALIPVVTILLAMTFLNERLTLLGWLGAALVIGGVVWVMRERLAEDDAARGTWRAGVWLGLAAVFCNAVGVLFAKRAMEDTHPFDAAFVRLAAGTGGLLLWGGARRQLGAWLKPFARPRLLGALFTASFIGTFLGIWLTQLAYKHTTASLTTIFQSMTPVFVLAPAVWILKEKVSRRAVLGAVLAAAGVIVLFFGKP